MKPGEIGEPEPTDPGAAEQKGYLLYLDPRDLLGHRGNLRRELGDLSKLEASIADEGVLQALTVIPTEAGEFRVVAGHRRTAAASAVLDAGTWNPAIPRTVPCLVRPDLMDRPAEQIWTMLDENDHRTDLLPSERSKGYAQLAAFQVPASEIARRASLSVAHLDAAIRLDKMDDDVKTKVDQGQLNFDDILALREFADDPNAEKRIIASAGTSWGARHEIATERKKRSDKVRAAEIKAELKAGGVREIARPKGWPYESKAVTVHQLVDSDGKQLDVEAVKTKDGFAAFIDTSSRPEAMFVCLDPEAMGYTRPRHNSYRSPEAAKQEEQAQATRETTRAALNVAASVRRRFIQETWGSAKTAKTLLVEALRTAAADPRSLTARDTHDLLVTLAGGSLDGLESAGQDRLQRVLVCRWIAAQEDHLGQVSNDGWSFKRGPDQAMAWLDRLTGAGYGLSDAETTLYDRLVQRGADNAREAEEARAKDEAEQARRSAQPDDDAGGSSDEMVFELFTVDGDDGYEWWLTVKDVDDPIDVLRAGPDAVGEAQSWAAGILDGMTLPVSGWRQDHGDAVSDRCYIAELAGEPASDGDAAGTGDVETGDAQGPETTVVQGPETSDVQEPDTGDVQQ